MCSMPRKYKQQQNNKPIRSMITIKYREEVNKPQLRRTQDARRSHLLSADVTTTNYSFSDDSQFFPIVYFNEPD